MREWAIPIALWIGAVVIVALSGSFLGWNILSNYGDLEIKKPYQIINPPIAPPGVQRAPEDHAELSLIIQKHSAADNRVTVSLQLILPDSLKNDLWVGDPVNGHHFGESKDDPTVITIKLADLFQASSSIAINVPVTEPFRRRRNGLTVFGYRTNIELPVFGQQDMYPNDWYEYGGFASVELQPPLSIRKSKNEPLFDVPLEVKTDLGVGMSGRQLIIMQRPASEANVAFVLIRDWRTRAYTVAMACVPLAFALVLFHLFFFGKGRRESARSSIVEALGASLTVLPLRAVLVPTEMPGLTRVDFLLGFALAITLGSLLAKYGVEVSPRKRQKKSA